MSCLSIIAEQHLNGTAPFGPMSSSRYARASSDAHSVLGLALGCVVVVWGCLIVEPPWLKVSRARCYAAAGLFTAAAGAYLGLWVIWLVAPGQSAASLAKFAREDVIQTQHAAIAANLAAAGCSEIAHAYSLVRRSRQRPWVHTAWFFNLAMVALTFAGHPQRSPSATHIHVALGVSLLFGSYLLACDKKADFPSTSMDAPLAAAFVGLAAVLLVAYDEPPEAAGRHRAVPTVCQPGWAIAMLSFLIAAVTFALIAVVAVIDHVAPSTSSPSAGNNNGRYELVSTRPATNSPVL